MEHHLIAKLVVSMLHLIARLIVSMLHHLIA